jgi:hypothetical protein
MADTRTLYDEDFVAWSKQQAAALRAAARSGSNLELDWQNLAEEVESLGASERRALHSQVQHVIRHLLKLEFFPATDPRRGWFETVGGAPDEIELVRDMNPSLRNELDSVVQAELARVQRSATCRNMAKSMPRESRKFGGPATRQTRSSASGSRRTHGQRVTANA